MKLWLHPQLKALNFSLAKPHQVQLTQMLWREKKRFFFWVIFCYALTLLLPSDYNQDIAKFSRALFLILSPLELSDSLDLLP